MHFRYSGYLESGDLISHHLNSDASEISSVSALFVEISNVRVFGEKFLPDISGAKNTLMLKL